MSDKRKDKRKTRVKEVVSEKKVTMDNSDTVAKGTTSSDEMTPKNDGSPRNEPLRLDLGNKLPIQPAHQASNIIASAEVVGDTLVKSSLPLNKPKYYRPDTFEYIQTIQRRGNKYMVKESLPSEEDSAEANGMDKMITDLYLEAMKLSSSASKRANLFRIIYILSTIIVTIAGVVIGVLTLQGLQTDATKYCAAVLGFSVTCVQTLLSTFSIERRGVLLKDTSNKLRRISRQIKTLQSADMKVKDKRRKLEDFYAEVDEMDLNIFDNNITTSSVTKATKLVDSSESSSDDNNYRRRDTLPTSMRDAEDK